MKTRKLFLVVLSMTLAFMLSMPSVFAEETTTAEEINIEVTEEAVQSEENAEEKEASKEEESKQESESNESSLENESSGENSSAAESSNDAGESSTGDTESGESESGESESGESESGESESGESESGESESGESESGESESGESESGESESGESESGESESGESESGESESGESESGESESGEGESGESESGEVDPDEGESGSEESGDEGSEEEVPEEAEVETVTTYSLVFKTGDGEDVKSSYTYQTADETLTIQWKVMKQDVVDGEAQDPEEITGAKYNVTIKKADKTKEQIKNTEDSTKTFVESEYTGSNTIKVTAYIGKEKVSNSITVEFADASAVVNPGTIPQNMPSGGSGGSSGSSSSGSGADEGIVAGTALISSHTSGTKDMTLYTDIVITKSETEPMLILGDTGLSITTNDSDYSYDIVENTMTLRSVKNDTAWTLSGLALKTLKESGIDYIELCIASDIVDIDTAFEPSGYLYGKLRAQGIVPSDFIYTVSANGVTVSVKGNSYDVESNSELKLIEECV